MEMNALYLDTNSMFNFDELYARIHELAVGSANYSTDLGEWRE